MSEERQFDVVNNPQATSRHEHHKNVDQLQYGGRRGEAGPDSSGVESVEAGYYVDPELVRRGQVERFVKDLRRECFRNAMLEKGLDYGDAYRSLAGLERKIVLRNGEGSSLDAESLAYMVAHPLVVDATNEALNDWLSTHGNSWSVKLEKDLKKANAKREKAQAKVAGRARSKPAAGVTHAANKSSPIFAVASFVVGLIALVLGLLFWIMVYRWIFN